MAMKVFDLYADLSVKMSRYTMDINRAKAMGSGLTNALNRGFAKIGANLDQISRVSRRAFIGLAAGLGFGVNELVKFDKGLHEVATMMTEQEKHYIPKYRKAIRSMAIEFGESVEDLNDATYAILSSQFKVSEGMGMLRAGSMAAVGGVTSVNVAVDLGTSVMNAYGNAAEDMVETYDKIQRIIYLGKTKYGELASSIGMVATNAALAKISLIDLGAMIAVTTQKGINSQQTMTALNGVIAEFGGASEDAKEMAKKYGFELTKEYLIQHGLREIIEGIIKARAKYKKTYEDDIGVIFKNRRAYKAMAAILSDVNKFEAARIKMMDFSGEMMRAYEENIGSLSRKFAMLKESFKDTARVVAVSFQPIIETSLESLKDFAIAAGKFAEAHPNWVKWGIGLPAAISGVGGLVKLLQIGATALGLMNVYTWPVYAAIAAGFLGAKMGKEAAEVKNLKDRYKILKDIQWLQSQKLGIPVSVAMESPELLLHRKGRGLSSIGAGLASMQFPAAMLGQEKPFIEPVTRPLARDELLRSPFWADDLTTEVRKMNQRGTLLQQQGDLSLAIP